MPHSSGGGSHSGGGGGGHSSGGGSSSGGGGSSYIGVRSTPYAGASRYVRYNSDHTLDYVYSDVNPTYQSIGYWIAVVFLVFVYSIFFGAGFWMLKDVIVTPTKMNVNDTCRIIDNAKILGESDEMLLEGSLNLFQDKTGIPVYFLTEPNDVWNSRYNTLTDFAFDWYVNNISDERHWLIVYTTDNNLEFEDWHFEGMQGDETDPIINHNITTQFNKEVQKNLLDRKDYSVSMAFSKAFDDLQPNLMKMTVIKEDLKMPIIWLGFTSIHCFIMVSGFVRSGKSNKKMSYVESRKYVKCPEHFEEKLCDYCGTPYVLGTIRKCPSCGAPLRTIK